MQPQALTRVSMRTLKDALHLFTGMPRLEADRVGAHGQGRSPSIFDRAPLHRGAVSFPRVLSSREAVTSLSCFIPRNPATRSLW